MAEDRPGQPAREVSALNVEFISLNFGRGVLHTVAPTKHLCMYLIMVYLFFIFGRRLGKALGTNVRYVVFCRLLIVWLYL